ncbi:hypothetical protein EYR41_003439 [Orbilia oligospora]|uniref:Uncharacterized protein n=1 Tax=Orbilia oligospora TaxID=2813651 RepID=A0A8H2HWM7_ORBOL|nr:hypothetical protein EYR41_003439 [Orbilia oligospora]
MRCGSAGAGGPFSRFQQNVERILPCISSEPMRQLDIVALSELIAVDFFTLGNPTNVNA